MDVGTYRMGAPATGEPGAPPSTTGDSVRAQRPERYAANRWNSLSHLREQRIGGGLLAGIAETAGGGNQGKDHDGRERRGRWGLPEGGTAEEDSMMKGRRPFLSVFTTIEKQRSTRFAGILEFMRLRNETAFCVAPVFLEFGRVRNETAFYVAHASLPRHARATPW